MHGHATRRQRQEKTKGKHKGRKTLKGTSRAERNATQQHLGAGWDKR